MHSTRKTRVRRGIVSPKTCALPDNHARDQLDFPHHGTLDRDEFLKHVFSLDRAVYARCEAIVSAATMGPRASDCFAARLRSELRLFEAEDPELYSSMRALTKEDGFYAAGGLDYRGLHSTALMYAAFGIFSDGHLPEYPHGFTQPHNASLEYEARFHPTLLVLWAMFLSTDQ